MQGQFRFPFAGAVHRDGQPRADNRGMPATPAPPLAPFPPPLDGFHPAVAAWFAATFAAPTPAQVQAWPAIRSGRHVLVSAPTGSGKTLTAFLAGIDRLIRDGLEGGLEDATRIVYVSPLKALSNDIHVNLELPLQGIREQLAAMGLPDVEIRTAVRTGDTPQSERAALRRRPPHILVTTPESLYVLLGSDSGRAMLAPARTVIVDEIHAVADDKRGSHLALSLERLEALCGRPLTRIGISATQKPIEEVARFLVGAGNVPADGVADCEIVDIGYARQRDLALVLPDTPLSAVMSNDQWEEVHKRIAGFAGAHRTTLVFVNTRRMAERTARHLGELLGKEHVAAHHGSLAKELRLDAEQRLKRGELKLLVATASLELGIDIGDVDLVCQLGSPRAISAFLQRAGRAGHHVGGVPKARLFPASRDDLAECAALLDCVRRGELDALRILPAPLDVLAQQIVAEVSCREWEEDALYDWLRRAWPYRALSRADFDAVLRMIAEGFATRRGARASLIHRDAVNRKLRGRKGGRMTAVMSGGTIPDTGDYAVLLEPDALTIGSINEDFAIESSAGDIFQLGNTSYRVLRIEPGRVRVEDAQGAPPTIPFWLGEAPGRTDELSFGVSRLREEVMARLAPEKSPPAPLFQRGEAEAASETDADEEANAEDGDSATRHDVDVCKPVAPPSANPAEARASAPSTQTTDAQSPPPFEKGGQGGFALANHDALTWLRNEVGLADEAAGQLAAHLAAAHAALGVLPTHRRIVLERFFDESGGTQLVIHSPFGSRINRAWGLALRKRFCRKFNFELQAAATEDAIVLSLSTSHSFPLIEVASYLHSASALDVLVQALLDAPLFGVRWRWNATTALALPRFQGGKKVPPQLQRMRSEDLLASVFPDQVACLENIVGERQVPDHPLVAQTLHDCLYEAMDAAGWLEVLRRMESGEIEVVARDLAAPSPLAMEAINAKPYAFLDDAPLEERRTQAVQTRRYTDPQDASDLGRLDPGAIETVREQAWPDPRNPDEMHEALQTLGFVTADEAEANAEWQGWLQRLTKDQRATSLTIGSDPAHTLWTCAERLAQLQALFPDATLSPPIAAPAGFAEAADRESAVVELARARLGGLGPVTVPQLVQALPLPRSEIELALLQLQGEGVAMQGWFTRPQPSAKPSSHEEKGRGEQGEAASTPEEAESREQATSDAGKPSTFSTSPLENEIEWCERHLLARIHRYTLQRLRREIEPVEPRDFVRFLCDWQKLTRATRVSGPDALAGVLAQLEGFEAPAAAWESELLPARVADYSIAWLDDQCTAGRTLWTRLRSSSAEPENPRAPASVRTTPIVLLPRRNAALWSRMAQAQADAAPLSSRAQRVFDVLAAHGASFFDDLIDGTRLLRTELEDALAELVARGRIHCDSFAGLRALLVPASKRAGGRGRRSAFFGLQDAGRWAPVRRDALLAAEMQADAPAGRRPGGPPPETVEHLARTLLRRYGVVCWRLLEREAPWLPPWRELVRVLHRLEARGEIRGGRFIAGLSGEQFALPEAIALMRQVRNRARDGEFVCVSAADPLNLAGTLLPGDKVSRIPGARLLLRDGLVVATLVAGEAAFAAGLPAQEQAQARGLLLREPGAHRRIAFVPEQDAEDAIVAE
jgi:ATP-dependent Lhr-like helicase